MPREDIHELEISTDVTRLLISIFLSPQVYRGMAVSRNPPTRLNRTCTHHSKYNESEIIVKQNLYQMDTPRRERIEQNFGSMTGE